MNDEFIGQTTMRLWDEQGEQCTPEYRRVFRGHGGGACGISSILRAPFFVRGFRYA